MAGKRLNGIGLHGGKVREKKLFEYKESLHVSMSTVKRWGLVHNLLVVMYSYVRVTKEGRSLKQLLLELLSEHFRQNKSVVHLQR